LSRKKEKEKFEIEKALLENEKKDLERKLLDSTPKQHVNNYLSAVFTPGQIKRLLDPSKKRIVWNNNNSLFTPRKQLQENTHGALARTKSGNKMHHLHRSLLQSLLNLFVETPQKCNSLQ
jgi:hypothetical protein